MVNTAATSQAPISALVLTFDEAANIERSLARLGFADEIVVLDSGSRDGTPELARRFPRVRVEQRPFDDHARQWNAGVARCRNDWILALDADYVLSAELERELADWTPGPAAAYFARFRYRIHGRPLRASLYPPRAVLFDRRRCRYVADGHTQTLAVDGPTDWLTGAIDHDDRKPLSRWLWAQDRYAALEVEKLLSTPSPELRLPDRLRRRIWVAPWLVPLYVLIVRGLWRDGCAGWHYALQRAIAEAILSLKLIEARWRRSHSSGS